MAGLQEGPTSLCKRQWAIHWYGTDSNLLLVPPPPDNSLTA